MRLPSCSNMIIQFEMVVHNFVHSEVKEKDASQINKIMIIIMIKI